MTKLIVRNLSPHTTVASVGELFSKFGAVQSVDLATDVMTGRCGGFGYVRVRERQLGATVLALNGLDLNGRVLQVSLEQKA